MKSDFILTKEESRPGYVEYKQYAVGGKFSANVFKADGPKEYHVRIYGYSYANNRYEWTFPLSVNGRNHLHALKKAMTVIPNANQVSNDFVAELCQGEDS